VKGKRVHHHRVTRKEKNDHVERLECTKRFKVEGRGMERVGVRSAEIQSALALKRNSSLDLSRRSPISKEAGGEGVGTASVSMIRRKRLEKRGASHTEPSAGEPSTTLFKVRAN